jgi:hypothetical protein
MPAVAPYLPFAIPVGSGLVGWKADVHTRFLRELSDCSGDAGTESMRRRTRDTHLTRGDEGSIVPCMGAAANAINRDFRRLRQGEFDCIWT